MPLRLVQNVTKSAKYAVVYFCVCGREARKNQRNCLACHATESKRHRVQRREELDRLRQVERDYQQIASAGIQ